MDGIEDNGGGPASRQVARAQTAVALVLFAIGVAVPVALIWRLGPDAIPGIPRSDFEFFFSPQRTFLSRWLARGIFPFWNPHLFGGYPTIETLQTSLFYPFHTLGMALLPSPAGMLAWLSLHVALAAGLTWLAFERALRLPRLAAVAGAFVHVLGGVFATRFLAGHPIILYALTWMPLALAGLMRHLQDAAESADSHASPWLAFAAAACGCVLLSGAPQYVFYLFYGTLAVALASAGVPWRRRAGALVVVWGLASLIAAVQWLPTLAYLPFAARGSGVTGTPHTRTAALVALLEFLWRFPLGDGVARVHLSRRGIWDNTGYSGTIAVLLALGAAFPAWRTAGPHRRTIAQSVALVGMGTWLTLGGWAPGFYYFREPLRGVVLVILGTAVLAAVGLTLACSAGDAGARVRRRAVAWAAAFCMLSLTLAGAAWFLPARVAAGMVALGEVDVSSHPSVQAMVDAIARDPWPRAAGPLAAAAVSGGGLGFVAIGALLLARRRPGAAMAILAAAMLGDVLSANARFFTTRVNPADTGWPDSARRELDSRLAPVRSGDAMPWRVSVPFAMTNASQLVEGLNEAFGYDPMGPGMASSRVPSFTVPPDPPSRGRQSRLRELALRTEIFLPPDPEEDVPQRQRDLGLRELAPGAVLAVLVARVGGSDDWREMGPRDGVHHYVDSPPDGSVPVPPALWDPSTTGVTPVLAGGVRHVPQASPNRMVFETETTSGAVLVVRSTWLPGWRVSVNGAAPIRALRANGWMTACDVPQGRATVRLEYRPPWLRTGMVLSLLGCAGVLVVGFAGRRRNAP